RVSYDQGNGWSYYLGFGFGTGSDSAASGASGDWDYESEYAVNATVAYSVQAGALKGTTVRLHGTILERDEFEGASDADETDLRLQVIIPYSIH
ncbi:porin, partial [Vibrio cholerae]|nr:porin [Vibrio cholerae]